MDTKRSAPNILITGTPGVGKSTLCEKLATLTGLRWLEISKIAKENNCLEEYDEKYQSYVLDEDKLLDGLEEIMSAGGNVVDYHSSSLFPERWFDIVFVLQADNRTMFDRLSARGYTGKKLEDNITCVIFGTALEEAHTSYKPEIVFELCSKTSEEMEQNVQRICIWIQNWFTDHSP